MILTSLKQSIIKKDVDHFVNIYKLKVIICEFPDLQSLKVYFKEINFHLRTIWYFYTAQVILKEDHEALK